VETPFHAGASAALSSGRAHELALDPRLLAAAHRHSRLARYLAAVLGLSGGDARAGHGLSRADASRAQHAVAHRVGARTDGLRLLAHDLPDLLLNLDP